MKKPLTKCMGIEMEGENENDGNARREGEGKEKNAKRRVRKTQQRWHRLVLTLHVRFSGEK